MSLSDELGLRNPITALDHEAVLAVVLTGQALTKACDRRLKAMGLTSAQLNVLMLLAYQCPEGGQEGLPQAQLGKMLLVNRANVTGLVDRLERDGMVERTVVVGDRRVNLVRLTSAGRALIERADEVYSQMRFEILEGLSEARLKQMTRSLEHIRRGIRERETE